MDVEDRDDDIESTEPEIEKEEEIVRRAKEFFRRANDADSKDRSRRLDDLKFCALGEQWPSWAKQDRSIPGAERPMLVINRTKQYVSRAVNSFLVAVPQVKVRPVDDNADPKTAVALEEVVRFVQQRSRSDMVYGLAYEQQVREGVGYVRIDAQFDGDESFDREIVISAISNPYSVYFDPDSSLPDGSDARECMIVDEMPRSEFERQYPGVDPSTYDYIGPGDTGIWANKDMVRVAEYWEVVTEPGPELWMLPDGAVVPSDQVDQSVPIQIIGTRPTTKKKVFWTKLAGSTVLDRLELECPMIPVVRFAGEMSFVNGQRSFRGMVADLRSSQIQYNFQQSALTELVGLQPLAPYITAAGQIEDYADEWAQANRRPMTTLRYKPVTVAGNLAGAPQRQPFATIPQGALQLLQIAVDDMKAVTGQFNASQGSAEESDQSGKAILAQQRQGDISLAHFTVHANQAIETVGKIIVAMIPKVYTKPTLFRILGEDGSQKQVALNPQQPQAAAPPPPGMKGIDGIYNPGLGKYDVTVATGPSFQTRRAESAAMLMQLVQSFPPLMQVAGDLVIRSLDSPVAEEIADRIRPPGMQEEDGSEVTPEVMQLRQQLEQTMQMAENMQQQLETLGATLKSKEEEQELKRYDAMTKRLQVIKDIQSPLSMVGQDAIISESVPDDNKQEEPQQPQPQGPMQ